MNSNIKLCCFSSLLLIICCVFTICAFYLFSHVWAVFGNICMFWFFRTPVQKSKSGSLVFMVSLLQVFRWDINEKQRSKNSCDFSFFKDYSLQILDCWTDVNFQMVQIPHAVSWSETFVSFPHSIFHSSNSVPCFGSCFRIVSSHCTMCRLLFVSQTVSNHVFPPQTTQPNGTSRPPPAYLA